MLQQGARSSASLYAELSQQLKLAVCSLFRVFSGLPSKATLPDPLPSWEYIDFTVGFLCGGELEQCKGRTWRPKVGFTGRLYFVHLPQTVNVASQFFQAVCCRHQVQKFAPAWFWPEEEVFNESYCWITWDMMNKFSSTRKLENLWLVLASFRVTNLYWVILDFSQCMWEQRKAEVGGLAAYKLL